MYHFESDQEESGAMRELRAKKKVRKAISNLNKEPETKSEEKEEEKKPKTLYFRKDYGCFE